ncbi:hypothetical protein A2Z67_04090 [Candidatus Woesebacteria bacterium RBG_13_36_22]|uniref:Uncharacterized protein n=1 Tax=Candidatus Woesebacteria bacterium RBG_13_36_22 TaxID=1802478 RepID=A0A1F7X5W8_9BACT|nr:MAG: hypothetical protein A2Z67_04090 [Candidatus Woesebacteria bacterium RBG_13_36_22]
MESNYKLSIGWAWVSLPHWTGRVEYYLNIITFAPPIAKWMHGKRIQDVKQWVEKKGGIWKEMEDV